MVENNLTQVEVAKKLEVSPAILSNYIIGKNIPEMDFLTKCIKIFGLEKEALAKFLYSAFLSSATNNNKVILDTRFIDPERFQMLAKILSVFVLYPRPYYIDNDDLRHGINGSFADLSEHIVFHPPAD